MDLRGSIDVPIHRRIVGWVCDTDTPLSGVPLVVAIGSRVLGRRTADQFRENPAIEDVGLGQVGCVYGPPSASSAHRSRRMR